MRIFRFSAVKLAYSLRFECRQLDGNCEAVYHISIVVFLDPDAVLEMLRSCEKLVTAYETARRQNPEVYNRYLDISIFHHRENLKSPKPPLFVTRPANSSTEPLSICYIT
jgi:hypothetical protein